MTLRLKPTLTGRKFFIRNMRKKIRTHFQKNDPILYEAFLKLTTIHNYELQKSNDYFASLCREIIGQQLNGKVARIIHDRFQKLFSNKKVSAASIMKIKDDKIRATGMAWSKVRFIKDLAQKVIERHLRLEILDTLENEDVIVELTKVKGIGPWTAEMFLMFALGRPDVFSHGDYGLKKAIMKMYGFKKEPSRTRIEKIVSKWSPYKTYACCILWESLDNRPAA